MKYEMPHSLFVVLVLLLMCCIGGYAQNGAQQEVGGGVYERAPPPRLEEKMMPGHEQLQPLQQRIKALEEKQIRERGSASSTNSAEFFFFPFHGAHVVEYANGELLAIYAAAVGHFIKEKDEFVEFLGQDMNNNGVWSETQVKIFGLNTDQYVKDLEKHKPHGNPRAVVALVEDNVHPGQENSVLRIVWMTTLKAKTEKYSLSYTSFNLKFPFKNGITTVPRFPANENIPILTMKKGTFVFPLHFFMGNNEARSTVIPEKGYNVISVDLTTNMEEIKKVLTKWTEQDKALSGNDCTSSDKCKYPIPTTGLVGYLSGKSDEKGKWNDEYHSVNADVSGVTKNLPNGLTFNGLGAGAKWSVSSGRAAWEYCFANHGFTLAATVTIHAATENNTPLLGVKLKNPGRSILFGVSYNNDNTWSTTSKGNERKAEIPKWEVGKEYSVILTFENGNGSAYINGTRIDLGIDLKIAEDEEIAHFYFGAYSEENTYRETEEVKFHVNITVKDVLLYNRGLLSTEIDAVVKNKANVLLSKKDANKVSEQATITTKATASITTKATASITTKATASITTAKATASSQTSTTSTAAGATPTDGTTSGPQPTKITENTNSGGEVNSQITFQGANTHQDTIDGTVRVYGYGLPLLLLGVWVFATVIT
ncbi:Trans-sialidase [Trypanosoma melophagium]|uniref:Trans-sialidase n=1 Tax=Trypanosoma melophagium TaxID=715481 RepID=UPI00351A764E|nr:Trans-sialidase [Trypanosoma melophagium]